MILEIGFTDYRMFKGKQILTFKADRRTKYLSANFVEKANAPVLKALALYGPNNSGKSNIVYFLKCLKKILLGTNQIDCNRAIFKDTNIFSAYITYFDELDDDESWVNYSFSYDLSKKSFVYEKLAKLVFYEHGQKFENVIFKKDLKNKYFEIYGNNHFDLLDILPLDKPFLHTISFDGAFSNLKVWKDSLMKCGNDIVVLQMFNIPIQNTIDMLKRNDPKEIEFINSFVKAADVSVKEFKYKGIQNNKEDFDKYIAEEVLTGYKNSIDSLRLTTTYGDVTVPSFFFDSSGTKKVEAVASYVYESITKGKLLIIDELDNGLHFMITRALISMFNNLVNTKGQIIFTAHDLLLIDCNNLLRKDQIYFINRDDKGSRLFSLKYLTANETGLREGASFIKRYNHGDFGSVPLPDFTKELIGVETD